MAHFFIDGTRISNKQGVATAFFKHREDGNKFITRSLKMKYSPMEKMSQSEQKDLRKNLKIVRDNVYGEKKDESISHSDSIFNEIFKWLNDEEKKCLEDMQMKFNQLQQISYKRRMSEVLQTMGMSSV